jgi:formiminotetrahydrofolate cyclodeaminase
MKKDLEIRVEEFKDSVAEMFKTNTLEAKKRVLEFIDTDDEVLMYVIEKYALPHRSEKEANAYKVVEFVAKAGKVLADRDNGDYLGTYSRN